MNCFVIFYLTITFTLPEKGAYAVEQTFIVDGTRNGSSGEITSPGYPGNYPDNVNYTWILRTGHLNASVNFTILDFSIGISHIPPCDDYLQITEKDPYRLALRRCGQFHPFITIVNGKKIAITFVTDKSRNAKGFRLIWKVHLPELITTMISTTPILTTTLKTTTTVPATTLLITTVPTTTLVITTIPTTTLSTLQTTLMKRTSQSLSTPVSSPHVSSTSNNLNNKTTTTPKEETSAIFAVVEATTASITHLTQTQTTTQGHSSITVQNNANSTEGSSAPSLKPMEILYLILGISVAEFALIASGICIIKRRQNEPSKQTQRELQVDKVRPISRKSVMSVANVYESIPLEHFTRDDIMEEDEERGMYVDLPEHVYDRSFVKRTRVNGNTNFYALITELKNKKA